MTRVRTQIQLEPEDHQRLKSFARRNRISISPAVRILIQRGLGSSDDRSDDERLNAFLSAAGAYDVARNHDEYLYGKK